MKTPETRAEFEHRLNLLSSRLHQGKMHFSKEVVRTLDGLLRVRVLPNGRIDLLSIDEFTRLQANMMLQLANMDTKEFDKQDDQ